MEDDQILLTKPIYLSSGEDTESQNSLSNQELTNVGDTQRLNQLVIHASNPTDIAQLSIPTYDINIATLSPSATTESQLTKTRR